MNQSDGHVSAVAVHEGSALLSAKIDSHVPHTINIAGIELRGIPGSCSVSIRLLPHGLMADRLR